jgi:hypothetical protein
MSSLRGKAILTAGGVAAADAGTVMLAPGGDGARPAPERAAVTDAFSEASTS